MDVTPSTLTAGNATRTAQDSTKTTSDKSNTLDYNAFLQLLIAEIKFQDPTQPMDPTQQISQLASFSAVEQSVKTNAKLDSLLTSFALSQADSVIGHTLTSPDGNTTGKVASVRIIDGGAVATLENGQEIPLGAGIRIS
jgi:flagellar basal-body rod modification protein FlgD